MRFFLVHELSCSNGAGRLRARACRPMTQVQAEILADTLDAIDGVEGVRVNPRVPSVLVLYRHAQARQDVLRSLAAQDAGALNDGSVLATLTQELESSLERHASGSRLPAHDEDEMGAHGFGPLMRFLFVRPFLPFKLRVASSVMGALPFLRKGLASLLQGKLNVDVLDAAAIGVSLLRRDFRTVTVLTLLLGLGEALEYWTRRRSMDSLTESLALNVDTVWVLADGVETSVPLSDVREGDLVVVRDGGSIPVDGIVEDGEAVVNQASMTGEPLGVARSKGAAVYSGTGVEQGHLVIRATHVGDGTRLKQVVRFIEESEALKAGMSVDEIYDITRIDRWFLSRLQNLVDYEASIQNGLTPELYQRGKYLGYPDAALRRLSGSETLPPFRAGYKMVDTCAAEFDAQTPYFYASADARCEARTFPRSGKPVVMVLGSGPIRIGQGIEFDYSSVHCVWTLKAMGYDVVIVNNNPETVSTDYDTADRLYFEPLTPEDVMGVIHTEKPYGVVVAFGGQTAIKLAKFLDDQGINVLGTSFDSIDMAEDRERFDSLLEQFHIRFLVTKDGGAAGGFAEKAQAAQDTGAQLIVLRRPAEQGETAEQILTRCKEVLAWSH